MKGIKRFIMPAAALTMAVALLLAAMPAAAELQTVTVGGQLRIRGNYWDDSFNSGNHPSLVRYETRWPAAWLVGRPIGSYIGGQNVTSHFDWDSRGADYKNVEQRTALNVRADFSQDVSAYIEFDAFTIWGEDFRSNYLTGVDSRGTSSVDLYQAYIDIKDAFGVPLRVRVGRQELTFGGGWLVGNNSAMPEFTYLSFDGVRATYTHDLFTVDAFWSKLADRSPLEEDGDTDFSGVYFSYKGIENVVLDAYWFWLRDAAGLNDFSGLPITERDEKRFGLDDYTVTNLHTVGLHAAGTLGAFDFTANAAYQFGDAGQAGHLFKPFGYYGDCDAEYDSWAADLDLGYTFDINVKPRVHLGGAYFDGEDNRSISRAQWHDYYLPYRRPEASVSFNRLFSNTVYSYFIDEMAELSNFWIARGGVSLTPLEQVETGLDLSYMGVVDTFAEPLHRRVGNLIYPLAPGHPYITQDSPSDIGWELLLWIKYHYSQDLTMQAGWSHLFTGGALREGNFNDMNGLMYNGGTSGGDADYFYLETLIRF